jgi:PPP family 3-phenylpropionic acid transporter
VVVPVAAALCVAGYALAARRVSATPRHEARPGRADVLALLRQRRLLFLLAACAAHWAATAPFHLFFGVFVRDHGLSSDVTGLGMGLGVGAEVAVLLAFPRLAARLPLRALFALAFAGSAVRWALLSRAETAWAIVLLQLLHGLTFGVFWGSAVQAMQGLVPPNLRATGQALFGAVVFGGGNAVGFALSGAGYDRYGSAAPLFAWAAGLEVLLLLAAAARFTRAAAPPEAGVSTS